MENLLFLVKADLLLHKNSFNTLREFIEILNVSTLQSYHYHIINDFVDDNEELTFGITFFPRFPCNQKMVENYCKNNYILINFETLKKFLSL